MTAVIKIACMLSTVDSSACMLSTVDSSGLCKSSFQQNMYIGSI